MPTIRKIQKYGWKPSTPDPRDYKLKHTARQLMRAFPKVFSLRSKMPPIYSQRTIGSCTAQAVCGAFHYLELTDLNLGRTIVPSRLFQYYNSRLLTGEQRSDAGASMRDAVKAAVHYGICREAAWPYTISKFAVKPPKIAYDEALKYQVVKYARVNQTLEDIKSCIVDGRPVLFGSSIFESFESAAVAQSGKVPMPKGNEACVGGHAELIVGYSDVLGAFEVRNSWGESWGLGGYCWFPYAYLTNPNLAADFWIIQEIEA